MRRMTELDRGSAEGVIQGCERDLRRKLSRGEMRDLLMDRLNWKSDYVQLVVSQLFPERNDL